jgi:hypothetical protein
MSVRALTRTQVSPAQRLMLLALGACCALALALAAGSARADGTVYKWTDAQGRVHYSDRPPPDGEGQAIAVNTGYNKPHSANTPAATPAAPKAVAKAGDGMPGSATDAEKKVAADLAAAHQGDCQKAKSTYDTYIRVRHLYKQGDDGANGERQFLTDAELEQARVDARRNMDEACGTGGQP